MFQKIKSAADYIRNHMTTPPQVGLVLGSGLGNFVSQIKDARSISYSDIPHFHRTSVEGHEGRLILGKIGETPVAVLQGRLHAYEGHDMEDIVLPTRVLAMLGIHTLFLTNAAGGINRGFRTGDLVLIRDHINLMGKNPLVGPNVVELGPRFPDMTEAYSREVLQMMQKLGDQIGVPMRSGVYCAFLGPTYETPAEIKMAEVIGADMVGMSTVPEVIAANHLGIRVCGISCITNMAAGIEPVKLSHEDVKAQATMAMDRFTRILTSTITLLKK
jgi:purine-nucleoside phosphorylase